MKADDDSLHSRREFIAHAGLATVGTAAAAGVSGRANASPLPRADDKVPFWGQHQAGVTTPRQTALYFATFDLATPDRAEVARLMRAWTQAAARMAGGETAQPLDSPLLAVGATNGAPGAPGAAGAGYAHSAAQPASSAYANGATYTNSGRFPPSVLAADSGETLGLTAARLTITFGFGAGIFIKDGKDRYGLAARRPEALVDMPTFPGDQFVEERAGGDLAVQACADNPQVAFHAIRQLARIADPAARLRWVQAGFTPDSKGETPRNLMGFKDGTINPRANDPEEMAKFVWVGREGPEWMEHGSYLVARRIRIALEHWDRMNVAFQEQTVGRRKYSGAPIGRGREFEALDLAATDKDGNPVIAQNAHVRLAAPATNGGAQILRRPYSYNDGVNFTTERWPPWRQGMEYDAGLFFVAYQRDPRSGFIPMYAKMSRFDMLNQFVTHVGGGLFACPGGASPGGYIGQRLLESSDA
jgi:deferrochelatase/peroxidase EfeB